VALQARPDGLDYVFDLFVQGLLGIGFAATAIFTHM
jgi:hypothetical protein